MMRPTNHGNTEKVRRILHEGPASSAEIADELQLSAGMVQIALWNLTSTGQAERCGAVEALSPRHKNNPSSALYRLTAEGERRIIRRNA